MAYPEDYPDDLTKAKAQGYLYKHMVVPVAPDGTVALSSAAFVTGGGAALLTQAAATSAALTLTRGVYLWELYGTWNGATAKLQRSPDGGTTWIDFEVVTRTADGGVNNIPLPAGAYRTVLTGAGAATSLTAAMKGTG